MIPPIHELEEAALVYSSNLPTIFSQMQFKAIWDRQDETTDRTKQWIAKETRSLPNSSQILSIIDEMVCNVQ